MATYDSLADLPLSLESIGRKTQSADTTSDFVRWTTTFELSGAGVTGRGEDVTYDTPDHEALADAPDTVFDELHGEWTIDTFSAAVSELNLFPTKEPERSGSVNYRQWALESAALDLALKQADTNLGSVVAKPYNPVRFVASTRLGSPPTTDRLTDLREAVPETEFKLDPTDEWDDAIIDEIQTIGGIRIFDLKGWYEGTEVDQEPDPVLYQQLVEQFPNTIIEDAAFTPETTALLESYASQLSFDYPINSVNDIKSMPIEPEWINIKPSRFGSLQSLFATIDYCNENDIEMYGGGQFELGVGRDHIQTLASLWYPDTPNDVAPSVYNDPDSETELPASPIVPTAEPIGFSIQ